MKTKLKTVLLILILVSGFGSSLMAQGDQQDNRSRFAVYGYYPMFYGDSHITEGDASFQIAFEKNWQSSKLDNWHYSFDFLFGRYFYNYPVGSDQIISEPHIGFDFSMYYGLKNHFLELGAGTDNWGITRAIVGYRSYIGNHFLFKLQLMPSTAYIVDMLSGNEYYTNYIDVGVGIGYQFNQKDSDGISDWFVSTWRNLSIQSTLHSFSYEEVGELGVSVFFDIGFSLFSIKNSQLGIYGGVGTYEDGFISQAGVSYLYGKNNHFIEANFNIIFGLLTNPKYEYPEYSKYRLLQPQIGYRYQFFKEKLFARIAYAPYIRTLDWKIEGGLQHNMVVGVGYRFSKPSY